MEVIRDLWDFPLIDHHCHAIVGPTRQGDVEGFLRCQTEAGADYPLRDIRQRPLDSVMRRLVHETTGKSVETDPELRDVLQGLDYPGYCRRLFSSGRYRTLLVDTGYAPSGAWELESMAEATDTAIVPVFRLETEAESLARQYPQFLAWRDAWHTRLTQIQRPTWAGVKSIAAYRSGLSLHPVDEAVAAQAFEDWIRRGGRLSHPTLVSYVVWSTAEHLIKSRIPVQFHVGYGDRDADLRTANPLHMREFLEEFSPKGLQVVLLHTYPYHREAGYLASVYPGVSMDVSLIIPHGVTGAARVLAEALDLAPMSRVLYASDAHTRPELFGVAASVWREALGRYLTEAIHHHFISPQKALGWAQMILADNAREVYSLE